MSRVFAGTVWPEFRADTVEAMAAQAEAIDGRRSFKTQRLRPDSS